MGTVVALPVGWVFRLLGRKGVHKGAVEPCTDRGQFLGWAVMLCVCKGEFLVCRARLDVGSSLQVSPFITV